ncbi:MAG: pyruvate, phosphate dikinase [Xanthomonadales bacterium]|nr:pyruvate, phosphate dikinase [Gammaproteobacteria bacterium]MBT8051919.1 pyruvate, phosphate dikinase [Gammaproteobacteria bacterium]NNJ78783.1 pyruvate, phosphate dikinase [Xanthomonadales bacterium]NNL05399.1 pyruvate, phosphate dikinase [Xanthomonadales bacterium]
MSKKYVYLFNEFDDALAKCDGEWEGVRGLLGGKGANLLDATRLGIPVPPGFTVTTEGCNDYLEAEEHFPEGNWEQILSAVASLEEQTGKKFGDPDNPLLVSCRSGAKFSMPGMMDTILNIGLTDEIVEVLATRAHRPRFAWDIYRRLVHMFGSVVLGVPDEVFEAVISAQRRESGVKADTELDAKAWKSVTKRFKKIIKTYTGQKFPSDPYEQLRQATEAVFRSWNGKRAIDYRNASNIAHDLGTAVNIQTMVFGNLGEDSATGVFMSRDATTGEPHLEGDFLVNAQGEDVVAGTRQTLRIAEMGDIMPEMFEELKQISTRLEKHHRNMQDMEFTVEQGKMWLLQTRDGKRTAQAEVRIAVDMVDEGLISREEAVQRVKPDQIDFFLHPQLDPDAVRNVSPIAKGLNVSPGAAVGVIAFEPDLAERWAKEEKKNVILVRPETRPDDVHGMLASKGVVTSKGGRTSHAALVARQFGKPAVVGVDEIEIDLDNHRMQVGEDLVIREGEHLSIDGNLGLVYHANLPTVEPDIKDPYLLKILEWSDDFRKLGVRANADYPDDAKRAREYGAQGIGLCRTEHMFFAEERLPIMQRMITASNPAERNEAIDALMPMQRTDFEGLFRAMDGLPVIIRLLDPPLHEFLPSAHDLMAELTDLKLRMRNLNSLKEMDAALEEIESKSHMLERVESLHESNPMLGTRGVRLGMLIPRLYKMQVQAMFEAAARCAEDNVEVHPEVMIPLVSHVGELDAMVGPLTEIAEKVCAETGTKLPMMFGTMIEIPRAALTASQIAGTAEFFSFGTNDLTQTTYGISRDDAETGFLVHYIQTRMLEDNPFTSIDPDGVGRLMQIAIDEGRKTRGELEIGVCGEHGGDPKSIHLCHKLGVDYVSCSPFRVPIARLAAAHAALAED